MNLKALAMRELRRLRYQLAHTVLRRRLGDEWNRLGDFRQRSYPDYATYVSHQRTKFGALRWKSVARHDTRFHAALSGRLDRLGKDFRGASVLCLAARQGTEVRAFIDRGAFAVGIDLNPGSDNRHVVVGDFHALQFADRSVQYVYTNSLDHAFALDRVIAEVKRVLRPAGTLIVEANASAGDGAASAGPYEAMVWTDVDALLSRLVGGGFRLESKEPFDLPWPGEQLVLRPVPAA